MGKENPLMWVKENDRKHAVFLFVHHSNLRVTSLDDMDLSINNFKFNLLWYQNKTSNGKNRYYNIFKFSDIDDTTTVTDYFKAITPSQTPKCSLSKPMGRRVCFIFVSFSFYCRELSILLTLPNHIKYSILSMHLAIKPRKISIWRTTQPLQNGNAFPLKR